MRRAFAAFGSQAELLFPRMIAAVQPACPGYRSRAPILIARDLVNYEPIIYVFTGTAGLLFTTVLLRTGLVAAWLARLGVVGYLAILTALPLELLTAASLDSFPGMLLYVPGGLFELLLPIVLIARGFRRTDAPAVHAAGERGSALAA